MRYFKFAPLDKKWSVITLGCWQIAPNQNWGNTCSKQSAEKIVQLALEHGITGFDTAEKYGDGESERRLGTALRSKKYDAIIISKIWPTVELSLSSFLKRLDQSLLALDRDYLDIYLVHSPGDYCNTPDNSKRLCEIMCALQDTRKVKVVGLSNFHYNMLQSLGTGLSSFSINQVPYNLLRRGYEGETLDLCKNNGIGYIAHSPTAQGLLAGRVNKEARETPARKDNRLYQEPYFTHALGFLKSLEAMAEEIKRKPIELALAWAIAQENILTVAVGSRKFSHVPLIAKASDLILDKETLNRLTSLSDSFPQVKQGRRNPP